MSILGTIFNKILSHGENKPATQTGAQVPGTTGASTQAAPSTTAAPTTVQQAPVTPASEVDVEQVLNQMAQKSGQQLNWRTSIVDLLKLLNMDSSLQARKELAHELHYTGSTEDSAAMNIWLHKQVMEKIADNGGKVPADLHA